MQSQGVCFSPSQKQELCTTYVSPSPTLAALADARCADAGLISYAWMARPGTGGTLRRAEMIGLPSPAPNSTSVLGQSGLQK
jgi:hypothetical protein